MDQVNLTRDSKVEQPTVILEQSGARLVATAQRPRTKTRQDFAFYLYLEGVCIERRNYTSKPVAEFVLLKPGKYTVTCFIRSKEPESRQKVRSTVLRYSPKNVKKRSIRLKEWGVLADFFKTPTEEYAAYTNNLKRIEYRVRTDHDGFMTSGAHRPINPNEKQWFFFGGSFVESIFSEESYRFPALVEAEMNDRGLPVRCLNGGYSGATSLHLINSYINKAIPRKPDRVFFFVPSNDSRSFKQPGGYWSNDKLLSPILPASEYHRDLHQEIENSLELALQIMKCITSQIGCDFIVLTTPHRHLNYGADEWLQRRFPNEAVFKELANSRSAANHLVRDWCGNNGVQLLDLERELTTFSEYTYDDQHLTSDGGLVVSRVICDYLSRNPTSATE
jgi:hypothetical protein